MNVSFLKKAMAITAACFIMFMIYTMPLFAHCDTIDGPVILDAKRAIEKNNVNYVLKWVKPEYENEIKSAFEQVMKVRAMSVDVKDLADKYFYDLLVRLHRAGEGVPITGVKPAGTPVNEKIKAADMSVEKNDFSLVESTIPKDRLAQAKELFDRTIKHKNFRVDDVKAGREYVEAYVKYFHFIEGGEEAHAHEGEKHADHTAHIDHIIRILSVVFFLTTIVLGMMCFRVKKKYL